MRDFILLPKKTVIKNILAYKSDVEYNYNKNTEYCNGKFENLIAKYYVTAMQLKVF